jgi:hypothetical protein
MVLPLLLGGAAVAAGAKGIQNFIQGQDQEKEAKKAAMRSLYNNMMHDPKNAVQAPIAKAPGVFETVVAPMAQAGVQSALSSGLSGGPKEKADDAAKTALASTPAPTSDPHMEYQQDLGSTLSPNDPTMNDPYLQYQRQR